jgi:antirestriction protein ArdC
MADGEGKKTVAEIFIEAFLRDVDEKGSMPWQRPYQIYNAFNWVSEKPYRGVNRLLLPFDEYVTMKQVIDYNKEHGTDYRYVPREGKYLWYPVVFFRKSRKKVSRKEVDKSLEEKGKLGSVDVDSPVEKGLSEKYLFKDKWGVSYFKLADGSFEKEKSVLVYHNVTSIKNFKNSDGVSLPSKLENKVVVITYSEPKEVIDKYIERSGIRVKYDSGETPAYAPMLDLVNLNPYMKSQEEWFSTAFHELGHSTGHQSRLNREGITGKGSGDKKTEVYAKEECIAEICAALCCSECNIGKFETSGTRAYENSLAYVQSWKKRVKDFGSSFIYICSQAEAAFNYIFDDDI